MNKELLTALVKFFSPSEVARILKTLPPLKTPVMDLVYPESRRRQKASAYIALGEIKDRVGNIPVVRKGTRSVPIDSSSSSGQLLEPEGFNPSIFIKASELNQLISLGIETGAQAFVSESIETLRDACRRSTETLCAMSLSGSVNYPMANETADYIDYKIDYGTIKTLTAADISNADLGVLVQILEDLYVAQQDSGFAGKIRYLAATDVYSKIFSVASAVENQTLISFTEDGIVIAGKYHILPFGKTYKKPGAATATPIIPNNYIHTIDLDAPHTLFYCAIDDIDANLAPMPFYAKPKVTDDPSGVKIIANSKPLPAPVVAAMRKQKVL